MENQSPDKKNPELLLKENHCIWMSAGVISFKLCPFDYDCDNCDFDRVMRQEIKAPLNQRETGN